MGKGNRTKGGKSNQASELDKYLTSADKTKNQKAKKNGLIISIVCIVLVVVMLTAIVATIVESTGVVNRITNVMKTEDGKYKVNKAMMNFFFNEQIMSWYSSYGTYASYFGLDFSKDLDKQNYSDGQTWYDYFLTQTQDQVKLYLAYANEADKIGLALDDEDYEEITEVIDTLELYIESFESYAGLGISVTLESFYGEGIKKSDIEDCYELIYMANKYSEHMSEKYKEELEKDNSAVIQFPEDNKEDFYTADVLKYSIKLDSKNYETDADYENAVKEAKERAEKIANATTPEEFLELVKLDLVIVEEFEASLETESASSSGTSDSTEEPTEEPELEDYRETIEYVTESTEVTTDEDGEVVTEKPSVEDWVWGYGDYKEHGSAAAGEHFTEDSSETYTEKASSTATESSTDEATEGSTEKATEKTYTKYTITAYHLEKPYHLDEEPARHLGYVISTDKTLAQSILDQFIASTSKSAELLDSLGKAEADKLGSTSEESIGHANEEYVLPDTFSQNSMQSMEDWLEEEGRKAGDYTEKLIEITSGSGDSATTYYGIIYYEADTKPSWEVNAINGVVNEMFETWYKDVTAEGGEHYITVKDSKCENLYQSGMPYILSYISSLSSSLTS